MMLQIALILLTLLQTVKLNDEEGKTDHMVVDIIELDDIYELGMLYDAKHAKLISHSPWSDNKTTNNVYTRSMPNTATTFLGGLTLNERVHVYDLSASVTCKVLLGIPIYSGSAKYLDTEFHTNYHAELAFHYHRRTHVKQLTMEALESVDYPDVIYGYNNTATHVITAIEYGATVVFQFVRETNRYNTDHGIDGKYANKLRGGFADANDDKNLELTDRQKDDYKDINCDIHSDINIYPIPVTFYEALEIYRRLHTFVNESTAVPIRAHLTPLSDFITYESKMVREISDTLRTAVSVRKDKYGDMKRRLGDMKRTDAYKLLPRFRAHVESFMAALDAHWGHFSEEIKKLLPQVRGAAEDEKKLSDMLEGHGFKYQIETLEEWIMWKEREAGVFHAIINSIKKDDVMTDAKHFHQVLYSSKYDHIVAYTFHLYPEEDQFSKCVKECTYGMGKCNQVKVVWKMKQDNCAGVKKYESWLQDDTIAAEVRGTFARFKRLLDHNNYVLEREGHTKTHMVIREYDDKNFTQPTVKIEVYEGTRMKATDFKLPVINIDPNAITNCNGTKVESKVAWNITSSSELTNEFILRYRLAGTEKTWSERHVSKLEDKIVSRGDFEVSITARCTFGICAEQYAQLIRKFDDSKCEKPEETVLNRVKRTNSEHTFKGDPVNTNDKTKEDFTVAALGRPFAIGRLYDATRDKLLLGKIPWHQKTLEKYGSIKVQNLTTSSSEIVDGIDLHARAKAFKMSIELTASFLGNLLKVHGAAKFLTTKTESNEHIDMAFIYKATTHIERMTDELIQFDALDFPDIVYDEGNKDKKPEATHVVTSIVYGANAVFRIMKKAENTSSKVSMAADVSLSMDIFVASMSGKAHVNLTKGQRDELLKMQCEFHGDVNLPRPTTSLAEAVHAARGLPMLINNNNSVPLIIHLTPLSKIKSEAGKILQSIKKSLLHEVRERMEQYDKYNRDIGDLKSTYAYQHSPLFAKQIEQFTAALHAHKTRFQMGLLDVLPKLRSQSDANFDELNKLLDDTHEAYKIETLGQWPSRKREESGALNTMLQQVHKENLLTRSGDFQKLLYDVQTKYVVSFTFHIYSGDDLFSKCVQFNCKGTANAQDCEGLNCADSVVSWLQDTRKDLLAEQYGRFQRIVKNAEPFDSQGRKTALVVREGFSKSPDNQLFNIEVYDEGKRSSGVFRIPTISDIMVHEQNSNGANVTWKIEFEGHSRDLFMEWFSVKYRPMKAITWAEEKKLKEPAVFIPIGVAFIINIRAFCVFGVCAEEERVFKPHREILLIGGSTRGATHSIYQVELYSPPEKVTTVLKLNEVSPTMPSQSKVKKPNMTEIFKMKQAVESKSEYDHWRMNGLTHHVAVLMKDRHVLVAGGFPAKNFTMIIDLANRVYIPGKAMRHPRTQAAAALLDGEVWMCGGRHEIDYNNITVESRCEVYRNGEWEEGIAMNDERYGHAMTQWGDRIYVVGGRNDTEDGEETYMSSIERYKKGRRGWNGLSPMKYARSLLGVAVIKGVIYACGGENATAKGMTACEKHENNAWEIIANMNVPRMGFQMFNFRNHLYAVGGYVEGKNNKWVEKYDPLIDTWTLDGELMYERSYYAGVLMPFNTAS